MCNWVGGFRFGLDIGVHDFKFSDTGWIWSLRKKLGSNPIANFHIRTPLVWCPSVHRRYLLRAWRCWTGYVQDFTSGLWWSDSDVWQTWRKFIDCYRREKALSLVSTPLSGSKKQHVLRCKSDSAFARFDKLCNCGHRMQRSKAVLCKCHRWQWQKDDCIKSHIRTSQRP